MYWQCYNINRIQDLKQKPAYLYNITDARSHTTYLLNKRVLSSKNKIACHTFYQFLYQIWQQRGNKYLQICQYTTNSDIFRKRRPYLNGSGVDNSQVYCRCLRNILWTIVRCFHVIPLKFFRLVWPTLTRGRKNPNLILLAWMQPCNKE